jgi:hypothetical protein
VQSDRSFMKSMAFLLVATVVVLAAPIAALSESADAQKSKSAPKSAAPKSPPMIFYLAKGDDDACGPGCSEWIAAEGQFDADTAQRLRAFLNRLGKRKLPIFFHSLGGNGITAMAMGRLLREREITAGVFETIPVGCAGASEQDCRALKQSGQMLPSTLRNMANCSSACVFALVGAKVRQVPPGARLGVHSPKVVVPWAQARRIGYSDRQIVSFEKTRLAEANGQARRYFQEMKIDVRLFDLLSKVPNESVHYLSRDEIVAFGIDTREFAESRWIATELLPHQLWTMKYFVAGRGQDGKELRTNVVRLACGDASRTKVDYIRGQGPQEKSAGQRTIKFAAGNQTASLTAYGSPAKLEAIESDTLFAWAYVYVRYDFLEAAAAGEVVSIIETDVFDPIPRITKLSTAGLSQAIATMRQRCNGV